MSLSMRRSLDPWSVLDMLLCMLYLLAVLLHSWVCSAIRNLVFDAHNCLASGPLHMNTNHSLLSQLPITWPSVTLNN